MFGIPWRKIKFLPALADLGGLVVVLVRARNPLNIGAAARAMSNFGARRLRLVNPYADGFREARSAVGAAELLREAEEFETVAAAVADCSLVVGTTAVRDRDLQVPLRELSGKTGTAIREQLESDQVALLFGSEKFGLSNHDFSHCHWLMNIPTHQGNISMNLGQAVAVCLYEIAQNEGANATVNGPMAESGNTAARFGPWKMPADLEPASAGNCEQISEALLESLHKSGYVKPGNNAMCEKKVRSLILRLNLRAGDAKVLLGMARQILWKLRQVSKEQPSREHTSKERVSKE